MMIVMMANNGRYGYTTLEWRRFVTKGHYPIGTTASLYELFKPCDCNAAVMIDD
jgi:hypothetical protein